MLKKVSVIVPTFNRFLLLKRALKSILAQTYSNIEILVVNDGGKDPLPSINLFHDSRLIYLSHLKNKGVAAARNTALKVASGDYIAYLDNDDLFLPNHIETLVNALESHSQFSVAYSKWWYAYTDFTLKKKPVIVSKKESAFEVTWPELLIDNRLPPLAVMHKRECLERVGYFDESLCRHEDWDFWIRLREQTPFLFVPIITAEYTIGLKKGSHMQTVSSWLGFFLNTMQIIHHRYHYLAASYPHILKAQKATREALRRAVLKELEELNLQEMSKRERKKLFLREVMEDIFRSALPLSRDDLRDTRAFTGYLLMQIGNEEWLWNLHAQLSVLLNL